MKKVKKDVFCSECFYFISDCCKFRESPSEKNIENKCESFKHIKIKE